MAKRWILSGCTCLSVLVGCGEEPEPPAQMDESGPVEDFPQVPVAPPGMRVIELAEQVIPPGAEVQLCHFLEPEAAEFYAGSLTAYQGTYGHHLVLNRALLQEEPGTVRDCTAPEDMVNLVPLVIGGDIGNSALADGAAIRVPAGTQMVAQQHYVNPGDRPLLVRDVVHLTTRAEAEVTTVVGFYALTNIGLQLTPEPEREQSVGFSCVVPRALSLRLMAPHMHELGRRISADLVRVDGSSERLIDVDPWGASYRDHPPAIRWEFAAPLTLAAGDRIEGTCVYNNETGREIGFPTEMCVVLGYFFPAPAGDDAWNCVAL